MEELNISWAQDKQEKLTWEKYRDISMLIKKIMKEKMSICFTVGYKQHNNWELSGASAAVLPPSAPRGSCSLGGGLWVDFWSLGVYP